MSTTTVTGYEPRFDFDLRRGQVGERKVGTIIDAFTSGTVEVKTDYGVNRTGNLYIEYEQDQRNGETRPSGIAATEATHWAFAFSNGAIVVETDALRNICRDYWRENQHSSVGYRAGNAESNGTRGIKLPVAYLLARLEVFT